MTGTPPTASFRVSFFKYLRSVLNRYPHPRKEITTAILSRAIKLCPELAPAEIRAVREPTIEDLLPLVIRVQCGFRPARTGGIRIEKEWWGVKGKLTSQDDEGKRAALVVYNYGCVCVLFFFFCHRNN